MAHIVKVCCKQVHIHTHARADIMQCASVVGYVPCANGGACIDHQPPLETDEKECVCTSHWEAPDCTGECCIVRIVAMRVDYDDCWNTPCLNNATCNDIVSPSILGAAGYTCDCAPGWTGVTCAEGDTHTHTHNLIHAVADILECASQPCSFWNATANDDPTGRVTPSVCLEGAPTEVICVCAPGSTGPLCVTGVSIQHSPSTH